VGVVIRIPMMLNAKRDEEDKVYDVDSSNNNSHHLSQLKKRQDRMLSYFQGVMPGVVRQCSHPH
jgi:hypothetical protein